MGNLQDQARFPANAFSLEPFDGAFVMLTGKDLPQEKNSIALLLFPLAGFYFFIFLLPPIWMLIPSLGVSSALSLDIASSCFLAVGPFACCS